MGQSSTERGHQTGVSHGQHRMSREHRSSGSKTIKVLLILAGLVVGSAQMALGAYLVSGNNGWGSSLVFSVVGLVGAVVGFYSWSARRSNFCMALAGTAVGLGVLGSMGLMLDVSQETSGIVHAWSQVPLALLGWILLWMAWIAVALARLLLFEPPRTRHRLSSRRGDAGN